MSAPFDSRSWTTASASTRPTGHRQGRGLADMRIEALATGGGLTSLRGSGWNTCSRHGRHRVLREIPQPAGSGPDCLEQARRGFRHSLPSTHVGSTGAGGPGPCSTRIRTILRRAQAERGQGLAAYALILALIAIVAIVALIFLGTQISGILSNVGGRASSASGARFRSAGVARSRAHDVGRVQAAVSPESAFRLGRGCLALGRAQVADLHDPRLAVAVLSSASAAPPRKLRPRRGPQRRTRTSARSTDTIVASVAGSGSNATTSPRLRRSSSLRYSIAPSTSPATRASATAWALDRTSLSSITAGHDAPCGRTADHARSPRWRCDRVESQAEAASTSCCAQA